MLADHQAERDRQLPACAVATDDDSRSSRIEAELCRAVADLPVDLKHVILRGRIRCLRRTSVHGSEHAEARLSGDESAGALVRSRRADGVTSTVDKDTQRCHFCCAEMPGRVQATAQRCGAVCADHRLLSFGHCSTQGRLVDDTSEIVDCPKNRQRHPWRNSVVHGPSEPQMPRNNRIQRRSSRLHV